MNDKNIFELFHQKKTPPEIEKEIALRLRCLRRGRKISQQKLSERAGVSLGSLKRFERTGEISLLSLVKLAFALGVERELEELFAQTAPQSIEEIINGQN